MQINFNFSRAANATIPGLGRSEFPPKLQARRARRLHADDADDLRALVRATALSWRMENAVWLAVAAAAAGVLLLGFGLAG